MAPPPVIDQSADPAWKYADSESARQVSLPEANGSVQLPRGGGWLKRLLAFAGPGYMVSVGYMDPGNWATDLAGGAQFGYSLLWVILLSNLMAILLQAIAARLGIVTGRDLAQACRDSYPRPVVMGLWIMCEIAIIACDVAEVIGTAIALQLLFHIPLVIGAAITVVDTVVVLLMMKKGMQFLEAFVASLLAIIAICFFVQIAAAAPPVAAILAGFIPAASTVSNPAALYLAIGIIGATVMPHNLYLHSSIVQTRAYAKDEKGKKEAIKWATVDSTVALTLALFINGAILILAAAVFHAKGHSDVAQIGDAFKLLSPLLGLGIASSLFAVALLASGINSSLTATLAGQIVMEGFLRLRLPQWLRRLITRAIAIVPVIFVTAIYGQGATGKLLILSQVVLSMQLPFAVIPLVMFVTNKQKMGSFAIGPLLGAASWLVTALIVILNVKLIHDYFFH